MTPESLFEYVLKTYGVPGAIVCVLLWCCYALFRKYDASMQERIKDSERLITSMDRNTQAINALSELIKDRK